MIGKISIKRFEFCYFFYMVILMAYMTKETRVLPGGLSQPIAWSIPFIWTIIIVLRNRVSFNNTRFYVILLICTIWSLIQIVYREEYDLRQLGLYFSFIYSIVIAYIHVNVYKKKLFFLYEECMVIMCKIALPLWMIANILPQLSAFVASSFPKTGYGWNILWVYNMMNPTMGQVQGFLTRNAGCSWEPGRFAIMLCLAILINLLYRGVTFYKNRNVLWLIASLITTFSTTGYVIVAGLYVIFLKKRTGSQYIKILLVAIAMGVMGSQLNFVGEKLQKKLNLSEQVEQTENNQIWFETQEQMAAIDRIPSLYYEWTNFMHNPWIGYGQDFNESYFARNYTSYYSLTGGLIKMFSVYGIFLGFLFYLLLYKSSVRIASEFHSDKKWVVFFCFCLSMISYPLFLFSIYTAIWLYNDFIKERR